MTPNVLTGSSASPITDDVPPRFRGAELTHVEAILPDVAEEIRAAIRECRGRIFQGPTGGGKTYAMAAAARILAPDFPGRGSGFIDWPEFVRDVKRWYDLHADDKGRHDPMLWVRNTTRPLFVDDVGAFTRTGDTTHEDGLFAELVDNVHRGAERIIFLTTNLTDETMRRRFGERAWSRLQQLCRQVMIAGDVDLRTLHR